MSAIEDAGRQDWYEPRRPLVSRGALITGTELGFSVSLAKIFSLFIKSLELRANEVLLNSKHSLKIFCLGQLLYKIVHTGLL